MDVEPGVCTMARTCGHAAAIEADGSVYACDHFVFPDYLLGNIRETPLLTLLQSRQQQDFGRSKRDALSQRCRRCQWLFACHGECLRNRFVTGPDGDEHQNYLCEGYRRYFAYVAPAMDFMRDELLAGRPPANVMNLFRKC